MDKKFDHLGERKTVKSNIEDFNLNNLILIIKKSLIWCILFLIISVISATIYLKYTQPVYSSSTTLMSVTQKQTQILGVAELLEEDNLEVDNKIQLIKSDLIIKEALDSTTLSVEYFTKGKIGKTELYKNNPFTVVFNSYEDYIIDKDIFIEFTSNGNYNLNYEDQTNDINLAGVIGKELKAPSFSIIIKPTMPNYNLTKYNYIVNLKNFNSEISSISKNLIVSPLNKNSKTLNISIEETNPLKAKEIVTLIANYFIEFDAIKKAESIDKTIDFLDEQIVDFGNDYYEVQDSMKQFRIESGFIDPSTQIVKNLTKIEELEIELLNIQVNKNSIDWLAKYLKGDNDLSNLTSLVLSSESSSFQNAITEISKLQSKRNQSLLNVTPDHPDILLINREIESIKQNLSSQIELVKIREKEKVKEITNEIDLIYEELMSMPDKETQFLKVKRENDLREQFYFNLVEKKNLYSISKAGIVSDYIILKPAQLSNNSIEPNVPMIRFFGVAFGLFLGLILITARYLLFNKITNHKEIEENTNAKFLGIIPRYNQKLDDSKIITTNNPKSIISESFRAIRSNLEFINAKEGPKVVATTSTVPGEGKTFVGINLAAIYSLLDKKVIILDFDLRKPRISKVFDIDSQIGVSTILIGKSTIQDCIYNSGIKNLDFITSGPIPPNPAELISSNQTTELIESLKLEYDYIFIDTPPVGLVTDAFELLRKADYPIYVVRAGYSERNYLENVNNLIFDNGITNLTTVLNDFDKGASSYYGAYGYGYGFDGGYYSDEEEPKVNFFKKLINKLTN